MSYKHGHSKVSQIDITKAVKSVNKSTEVVESSIARAYTDPATSANGGCGWYLKTGAPLVGLTTNLTSNNIGAASILLEPKVAIYESTVLTSDMHFNYAHQIVGTSISLGVSSTGLTGGVNYAGGAYDELSTTCIYRSKMTYKFYK